MAIYVSGGQISRNLTVSDESMYVYNGGSAYSTTLENRGIMNVYSGGNASWTTVGYGGRMNVYLNGKAYLTTVCLGGSMNVYSGGKATSTTVSYGGTMHISNGGVATSTTLSNGSMLVCKGGVATSTALIGKGQVYVSNGGLANHTVMNGGTMYISSGGIASWTVDVDDGMITILAGGTQTGRLSITSRTTMMALAGRVIDFDISVIDPGGAELVNNLTFIEGTPNYTLTVSVEQTSGEYRLAYGAGGFDGKTLTVRTAAGTEFGTLGIDGELDCGGYRCRLAKRSGALMLTVEGAVSGGASGDLNGDGRSDVVMTIAQAGHPADGATGAWLIQADQTAAWGDLSQRESGWEIFGTGVTAAGKSTNDVYIKSTGNVVGAWGTDDTGKVAGWQTVGEFDASTQVLGLGDFNGDGQTDLLLRNTNGAVGCHLTDGTGWNYFQSLGDEWSITAVGDLNGDGRSDVVLKHDAGFAGSWLTQGDCTMAWADLDTLPEGFSIVGAGDFDGDGTDDVLLKNGSYYGAWVVENGNAKSWMGLGDLGNVTVEQIGDFDADGKDDLRIRTSAGDLGAQLVKGADTLTWKYYGSVGAEWSTSLAAI